MLKFVYLRRQDEIIFGETFYRVCKGGDFGITPAEFNIRVVTFTFREFANLIYKGERLGEVLEGKPARNIVVILERPLRRMRHKRLDVGGNEFSYAEFTGFTFFIGEVHTIQYTPTPTFISKLVWGYTKKMSQRMVYVGS